MIRTTFRPAPGLWGILVAASLLGPLRAPAQDAVGLTIAPGKNALRLDLGGVLARNIAYNVLNNNPQVLLPLLLGYERLLSPNFSGNVEVLLNGGHPRETMAGLALQGRYYLLRLRHRGLNGMYAAPTLSYRSVHQRDSYGYGDAHCSLGGAGVLLGVQLPLTANPHWVLDISGGMMAWTRLSNGDPSGYINEPYNSRNSPVFDGRISLGYQF